MTVWVVTATTYWPEDGGMGIIAICGTKEAAEREAEKARAAKNESEYTRNDEVDIESYPVIV